MKPSDALAAHRNEIREIVLSHRTSNARVFGSVVHGSDTEESDLDILVDTTEDTTLFDLGAIRYKLRNLLGVQVDVLTPAALPEKFLQTVIADARPVWIPILYSKYLMFDPKDIRNSKDPDLAGSYAAIHRAAKSAEDLAIKTNTAIIVSVDGKPVRITAAELIKKRELESAKPTPNIPTV